LKKLKDWHVPFVRSANNHDRNKSATKKSPAIKNVISAYQEKKNIDRFKTDDKTKNFDSYYTHPHQVKKNTQPKYILDFFNNVNGKDK